MVSETAALSGAICDIYDAAVDSTRWTQALQTACKFVGGEQAVLFWQDTTAEDVVTLHRYNDDPHYTRLYHEVYAPLNPVFPAAIFQDVGAVHAATDLVPWSELRETRFFREWIAPQGMGDSLGVLLEKDALRAAFLSLPCRDEVIDEAARQRLGLLVPHFQRAVAIGRLFVQSAATTAAFARTLDRVDAGVFLLADKGRIVFANAPAQRMLDEGTILRAARETLGATNLEADRELKQIVRAIEGGLVQTGGGNASVVLSDHAGVRWIANLLPLVDGERRRTGEMYAAIAAVFVRSSQLGSPLPLETIARHYGLTASEIRVTEAILRVTGVDAISEMLGISRATVKTHLNRILRKSGAKNQSELIKVIAGLA